MSQDDKPKTLNQLMRHLRDDCHINISGSNQKHDLQEYGYYHGYKGYRFYNNMNKSMPFTDFSQIVSVIEYDNKLKSAFYPLIMDLEMTSKNLVLIHVTNNMNHASFDAVYKNQMQSGSASTKRLRVRDSIYSMLSKYYNKAANARKKNKHGNNRDEMIYHFYNRGQDIPLWVIFEIIPLGNFADFTCCINIDTRKEILKSVNMLSASDTNCQLLSNILYTVKSLRNAIAHNNVIFDIRFQDQTPYNNLRQWIKAETCIQNINFTSLVDYLILVCAVLNRMSCKQGKYIECINSYSQAINDLYAQLPDDVYNMILPTDTRKKIEQLKKYLNKKS